MSKLIKISKHTFIYRGFTINKCPRNSVTLRAAYNVLNSGDYYGRDFALAEAMKSVDKIRAGVQP